jgi:ribosomal protein S18 acetylase RimI-like enzyme
MADGTNTSEKVRLRWDIQPGDFGALLHMHGILYAKEYGFDYTFEGYVAGTLGHFKSLLDPARERLWLAEVAEQIVGSIAIVKHSDEKAQLRWLLVDPAFRGRGVGSSLVREAVTFAKGAGYRSVFLDTVKELVPAALLYRAAGFVLTAEESRTLWGCNVTEQRYELCWQE